MSDPEHIASTPGTCQGCGARVSQGADLCGTCLGKAKRLAAEMDDRYRQLAMTIANGDRWPVCPCGGTVRPVNTWSDSYYRCDQCGTRAARPPALTRETEPFGLAQLERLLGRKVSHE